MLVFKGIHLDIWHVEISEKPPGDLSTFVGACGRRMNARFVDYDEVDDAPESVETLCSQCAYSVWFIRTKRPKKPVKLVLKAIKGATESWRREWMKP